MIIKAFLILSLFCNTIYANTDVNQDLLNACKSENLENVKLALAAGADVNSKDAQGNSALVLACVSKTSLKSRTIKKLLIEAGADVNAKDKSYGMPILTWMFVSKDYENIKLLVQHKVDVNGTNKDGSNLLALAASFTPEEFKASSETLELLVSNGLNLNPTTTSGETILTH